MNNAATLPAPESGDFNQQREKLLRDMLSAVAHDLKTPLASVIGSLEVQVMLAGRIPPEKQAELLTVALREARRLDGFITNLLDMAKLERGGITPNFETADIGSLLQASADKYAGLLRGGAITVDAAAVTASTDPTLLARAVGILFDNALSHGGDKPLIEAACGADGESAFISVRDRGRGIPADKLDAIFAKYQRTDGHANAAMGLGLPIARGLLQLLNGEVIAANHPGGGAIFSLRFPLTKNQVGRA